MHAAYGLNGTVLRVENLSVSYGGKTILQDINLVEHNVTRPGKSQGQIIAFVGRSGRGKSTLLRTLTGLEKPTTGRVLIPDYTQPGRDGQQPAKVVGEGDIGFVNQSYTLFRHKTVYQALYFALRKTSLSGREKEEKVMTFLNDWGLACHRDKFPVHLSGGQRQRVAILEQLLSAGYYMVLDEPFSGLDVGNIESVKCAFGLINRSHDLNTLIFSTHDVELAVQLADSIYVLGFKEPLQGESAQAGTIVEHFDLKAMGLCWQNNYSNAHTECAKEIKARLLIS